MNIPEEMRKPNNDLDAAIADVGRILDYLMNYRNIVESGSCNDCAICGKCKYCPKPGQLVRYNCPHYVPIGHKADFSRFKPYPIKAMETV